MTTFACNSATAWTSSAKLIINTVEKESPFPFFTPYELYLKFLAEYFRDYLGDRSKLNSENLPQNFRKLQ
ncbi:MAG: hypothetical protein ABIP85_23115 [Chthoniobacteraceae bacterium]